MGETLWGFESPPEHCGDFTFGAQGWPVGMSGVRRRAHVLKLVDRLV